MMFINSNLVLVGKMRLLVFFFLIQFDKRYKIFSLSFFASMHNCIIKVM